MDNLEKATALWQQVVDSWRSHNDACRLFQSDCDQSDRITILKRACSEPLTEALALTVISQMQQSEQLMLLCPLLQLVVEGNIYSTPRPEDIILSLPRESALADMRKCIEAIRQRQDYDELEMLVVFLQRFDRNLAIEVSRELISQDKKSIRELGRSSIKEIEDQKQTNIQHNEP